MPSLLQRARGCLLGLAVGDAAGRYYEGVEPGWLMLECDSPLSLIVQAQRRDLRYTDDTQMAIAIAETLAAQGDVSEAALCKAFVDNYHPWRGYGRGARLVLEAMQEGRDYEDVAANHFPGGSFGNGAAMRVAPVGFFFHRDSDRVWARAEVSARPTHVHLQGIEGAQLLAMATAWAAGADKFDKEAFYCDLLRRATCTEFREKLELARQLRAPDEIEKLGNGIAALESVVTAIACFAEHSESYVNTIARAVYQGGDTDTIAAMAGAISGAFLGIDAIPASLLDRLEDEEKGRSYIRALAGQMVARM